jgi:hypothetical protein
VTSRAGERPVGFWQSRLSTCSPAIGGIPQPELHLLHFISFTLRPRFRRCFALGIGGFFGGSTDSVASPASADALFVHPSSRRMGLRKRAFTIIGSICQSLYAFMLKLVISAGAGPIASMGLS